MARKTEFHNEYGFAIKRLLPDSISKCERLMSSPNIVIRLVLPGTNQTFFFFFLQ